MIIPKEQLCYLFISYGFLPERVIRIDKMLYHKVSKELWIKRRKKMKNTEQFEKEITPFYWVALDDGASVCLTVGEYLQEIFDTREEEGFIGNGYDWGSLAQVFLDEKCPDLQEKINFDPEADMFCAYSKEEDALADFILRFKKACEDKPFILDLFSRAELD